jgi:hypothetical protein
MHVSTNIIGFPVQLTSSAPLVMPPKGRAEIVHFPAVDAPQTVAPEAHAHGKMLAAHRIVSRVADQLEQTAAL